MSTSFRTARRLLLGREIAHMISASGQTQADAAKIIEKRQSYISGLLAGERAITVGDLERLATQLGVTDPDYHETLRAMRRDNTRRGFWTTGYRRAYPEEVRLLVDLEGMADRLRAVEVEVVPALVQCESYVRALHQAWEYHVREGLTVEERVQARLARQEILNRSNPPACHMVLSESCLRREYGGAEVMREQIDYLIDISRRPNIFLQIMPFRVRTARGHMANRFVLLRVPSPGRAGPLEMSCAEGEGEIRYLDDERALTARENAWAALTGTALNFADSRQYMRHIRDTF